MSRTSNRSYENGFTLFRCFTTLIASEPGGSLGRMGNFNLESEAKRNLYSAPTIEMIKLEAISSFLDPSGVDGGGDAGEGEDGGEF